MGFSNARYPSGKRTSSIWMGHGGEKKPSLFGNQERKGSERSVLQGSGQGINAQFLHRVMFKIIGDENELVVEGDGCDRNVGARQGNAFAGIVTLQIAFRPPAATYPPT